jgi:hypothetical protein
MGLFPSKDGMSKKKIFFPKINQDRVANNDFDPPK